MMEKQTLGSSSLNITRVGLGLAALGRPGYINLGHAQDLQQNYDVQAMQNHAHDVLDAAWTAGIRYFDAARSYGRAEVFLGSWLTAREISPSSVAVGSKWGYTYTAGWKIEVEKHEVKEHSLPVLQRQIKESQTLLGSYLNLYQIHSATLDSGVLENSDVLKELARLREGGLLIGLSLSGANQAETLRRAMAVRVNGRPLFNAVQATWNLLEQSAGEALQEAHEAGMGVIIKEAVANGRLTPRNQSPAFQEKMAILQETAAHHNITVDALALAAVLAQPWVDVVLSGASTVEQLQSNVLAVNVKWDEETAVSLRPLLESPQTYWQTRSHLAWN
ncbi:MAG: aldo/keto reductase [Ardenticatenaceae bacterium]|nr:aldo/keto reductase [Ardenticatenaceae bacterium]MCB9442992.1 aldo/keto reductase [Ardenticatenaceae bacterium]